MLFGEWDVCGQGYLQLEHLLFIAHLQCVTCVTESQLAIVLTISDNKFIVRL